MTVSGPGAVPALETGALALEGHRLFVRSGVPGAAGAVEAMLTPPCTSENPAAGEPDWTLHIHPDPAAARYDDAGDLVVHLPYGRCLAVRDTAGGVLRLAARYRPDAPWARIEVDGRARSTRLLVAPGDRVGVRWADWLGRVFFASRLLARGWRMLHASAVELGGRALLFLAGSGGGKSTLAHRAVRELGARFLADDLVLVRPGRPVIGWPTRIALPAALDGVDPAAGRREQRPMDGWFRDRVLFTPAGHRRALGVRTAGPTPPGALIVVEDPGGDGPVTAAPAGPETVTGTLRRAAAVDRQRVYVSDVLGLMGGPRLTDHTTTPPGACLTRGGLPVVRLAVPARALPTAAIWDALAPFVPSVGGHR
ncbi:hypothetical protein [Streptomyces clavuligerus]|nr:hypothetical protein [Streptomyces clavuligerus]WDN56539.1 hypothetical protein LL058_32440 [Streptomyces clavuligerus]